MQATDDIRQKSPHNKTSPAGLARSGSGGMFESVPLTLVARAVLTTGGCDTRNNQFIPMEDRGSVERYSSGLRGLSQKQVATLGTGVRISSSPLSPDLQRERLK